jgi:hypothetical protein
LTYEVLKSEIKNKAFKYINHFLAKNQLSNTLLNEIIQMFGDFINDLIDNTKNKTIDLLPTEEQKKDILQLYNIFVNPFDFISSVYEQQSLLEDSGFAVSPQSINIGKRDVEVLSNEITTIVSKDVTFEYVSIYATFEKLLQNKEFFNTIELYATICIYMQLYTIILNYIEL